LKNLEIEENVLRRIFLLKSFEFIERKISEKSKKFLDSKKFLLEKSFDKEYFQRKEVEIFTT